MMRERSHGADHDPQVMIDARVQFMIGARAARGVGVPGRVTAKIG